MKLPAIVRRDISVLTDQRGAALLIGLVMLVLLTLIGVSAMQTTSMQERMAGNMRDRDLALQAAEAALRAGESWLETETNRTAAESHLPLPEDPATWSGNTPMPAGVVGGLGGQLVTAPVFHVASPLFARVGTTLPPQFRRIYRITARAEGGTTSSVAILQTMFEPL